MNFLVETLFFRGQFVTLLRQARTTPFTRSISLSAIARRA
jgi:hypothetical protein